MPLIPLTPRSRRTLLFVVLLALVLGQTLGALHRLVHASRAAPSGAVSALSVPAGTFEVFFAGHHTERDCDQYDQASHADIVWGVHAVVVATALTFECKALPPGWQLAAQAAGFLARGPPVRA
jgi:hypothetical protein